VCYFAGLPTPPLILTAIRGDQYVDVVGVDAYEVTVSSLRTQLGAVVDYAQAHDKVAVFSETGDRAGDANSPIYWKNVVLPGIVEDPSGKARKIAWALTWINASWSKAYVAHGGSSQTVKQSFIDFKNSPNVIFGDEIPDMFSPLPEVVAVEENGHQMAPHIQLYPNPVEDKFTVQLFGFEKNAVILIYDALGRLSHRADGSTQPLTINSGIMNSGIYFLKASDSKKSMGKKLFVR